MLWLTRSQVQQPSMPFEILPPRPPPLLEVPQVEEYSDIARDYDMTPISQDARKLLADTGIRKCLSRLN